MADDDAPLEEGEEKPKPQRRRRRTAATTGSTSRLERRAGKVAETVREMARWRLGDRGAERLGFVETVDRDASKIGHAVAAIGERFKSFGQVIDLVFGATGPIAILVALAPSIRAGRDELRERRRERQKLRQEEQQQEQGEPFLPDPDDPSSWPSPEQFQRAPDENTA